MNTRRLCFLVVAFFLAMPLVGHASAQDGTELQCTGEDIAESISAVQAALDQAQAAVGSGDLAGALDALEQSLGSITDIRSKCRGWYFTGNGNDVIGPIELEGGVYKLEYSSSVPSGPISMGMFNVQFENVDEDESIWDEVNEMLMQGGDFSGGTSIRLEGGRYLINVEAMYVEDWIIQITKP